MVDKAVNLENTASQVFTFSLDPFFESLHSLLP